MEFQNSVGGSHETQWGYGTSKNDTTTIKEINESKFRILDPNRMRLVTYMHLGIINAMKTLAYSKYETVQSNVLVLCKFKCWLSLLISNQTQCKFHRSCLSRWVIAFISSDQSGKLSKIQKTIKAKCFRLKQQSRSDWITFRFDLQSQPLFLQCTCSRLLQSKH